MPYTNPFGDGQGCGCNSVQARPYVSSPQAPVSSGVCASPIYTVSFAGVAPTQANTATMQQITLPGTNFAIDTTPKQVVVSLAPDTLTVNKAPPIVNVHESHNVNVASSASTVNSTCSFDSSVSRLKGNAQSFANSVGNSVARKGY